MFLTSIPPIEILPLSVSKNLAIRLAIVVFPPPEGPTNAIVLPSLILKLILSIAFSDCPG